MRFDRATIALEPLTLSNCLDMSLRFLRAHAGPIFAGWLSVAVPTCVLGYLAIHFGRGTLMWGLALLALASAVFEAYLIAGTGLAAFGDPFTFASAWRRVAARRGRMLRQAVAFRFIDVAPFAMVILLFDLFTVASGAIWFFESIVLMFCLLPVAWATVRYGFTLEQTVLGRTEKNSSDRQVSEIVKHSLGDLIFRGCGIALFCGLLWLSLAIGIDQTSTALFQFPLFIGRMNVNMGYTESMAHFNNYKWSYLWEDPGVIIYLLATALAAYPLGRLAWFFCYIDLRVRQDCWDIELQIQQEAERLEGRMTP